MDEESTVFRCDDCMRYWEHRLVCRNEEDKQYDHYPAVEMCPYCGAYHTLRVIPADELGGLICGPI